MLENYFNYKKHKTDFKTEVIAGTTTFLNYGLHNVFKSIYLIGRICRTLKKDSLISAQFILQQF